jgi:hypothetical protein
VASSPRGDWRETIIAKINMQDINASWDFIGALLFLPIQQLLSEKSQEILALTLKDWK